MPRIERCWYKHGPSKAILLGMLIFAPLANASENSDTLSACLIASATDEDKRILVQWMFVSAALHPAVADLRALSISDREQANREMAELLVEFLTVRCVGETQAALLSEGALALQVSMGALGQLAATNLFGDTQVTAAQGSLETYINAEDLERRLQIGQ